MFGFDARHSRGHIYRSILEAIAITMKNNVDAMATELNLDVEDIVVSGGGSNGALFMQIFSDVFGLPTSRAVGPSGASLGAAICAAAAAGLYSDIESAVSLMAGERQRFEPNLGNHALYTELASQIYPSLNNTTDGLYQQSQKIFNRVERPDT